MKIGIMTQKLENNYGGILQNYALQTILKQLGHTPITIDFRPGDSIFWYFVSWLKTYIEKCLGKKVRLPSYSESLTNRSRYTSAFIDKYINTTKRIQVLTPLIPFLYRLDCVIVGSDQVWRAKYNVLRNTFLAFIKGNVIKLAYAASFGVSEWEYNIQQTKKCCKWIKDFRAVSTREESGVLLCQQYLKTHASHVLDPTMLLSINKYNELCKDIKRISQKPYLFAYVLDPSIEIEKHIRKIAELKGLEVVILSAEKNITKGIEYWLACFRDANYIITDSFHGSVFSIIYNKPFNSIINIERGADRFLSLLSMLQLENKITSSLDSINWDPIDWDKVNIKINSMKDKSFNFLKNNLR